MPETTAATEIGEELAEIRRAAARIQAHVRRTPLLRTDISDGLVVKPESLQVTGSFKARGAVNAVLSLREREPGVAGLITHSSGNHGQALAYAARRVGLAAAVVIPANVTPAKIEGIKNHGARVVSEGVTFDNREAIAEAMAAEEGLYLVHPYDDWDIIHGAGTIGLEILEDAPGTGTIVVPVGGGGQISGVALAAGGMATGARVIGVEPDCADDAARSLHAGQLLSLPADPETLAEGVKSKSIGERNFDVMVRRHLVDDIVTVSEGELEEATRVAWVRLKLAIEPTAALSLAAYLTGRVPAGDSRRPTVITLSGGNFDARQVARILGRAQAPA